MLQVQQKPRQRDTTLPAVFSNATAGPIFRSLTFQTPSNNFPEMLYNSLFLKSTHLTYQLFSPKKINSPLKTYKQEQSSTIIVFPPLHFLMQIYFLIFI